MKYLGSKRTIAKQLNDVMSIYYNDYPYYVEPFVGGANMIKAVTHHNKTGYDINEYVIAYFNALKNGWLPPKDVSEELYKDVKNNKENYPKELVCFIGFTCSFAGKWFGGYARSRCDRNYANVSFNSAIKKDIPFIQNIEFKHSSYQDISFKDKSIIYCDPPYLGTTGYKDKFNHDEFYTWLFKMKDNGNKVFISEYAMSSDFKEILAIPHKTYINGNNANLKIEKLFTI